MLGLGGTSAESTGIDSRATEKKDFHPFSNETWRKREDDGDGEKEQSEDMARPASLLREAPSRSPPPPPPSLFTASLSGSNSVAMVISIAVIATA